MTLVPDLAVEVVSPNDLYYEVEAKVAEYMEAGVQMVWLINPVGRNVRVFRPGKSTVELSLLTDLPATESFQVLTVW